MPYKVTIKYTRENESVNFYELADEIKDNTQSHYEEVLDNGTLLSLSKTITGNVYEITQVWANLRDFNRFSNSMISIERREAINNYNAEHDISKTVIIESS
jgi:hypothetical protein